MVKTCTQCGRPNNNLLRVCVDCGADLADVQDEPTLGPAPRVKPTPRVVPAIQLKEIFGGRRATSVEWMSVVALIVAIASAVISRGALICLKETEEFYKGRDDISGGTAFSVNFFPLLLMFSGIAVTGVSVVFTVLLELARRNYDGMRGFWLVLVVPLWLPGLLLSLWFLGRLF